MQTASPIILGLTAPFALTTGAITSLVTASVSGAINYFFLLPRTQKIKEERKKVAKEFSGDELEAKDAPLRKSFGQSHGLSLLFNMTNVLGTLAYGIYLSRGLLKYVPKWSEGKGSETKRNEISGNETLWSLLQVNNIGFVLYHHTYTYTHIYRRSMSYNKKKDIARSAHRKRRATLTLEY